MPHRDRQAVAVVCSKVATCLSGQEKRPVWMGVFRLSRHNIRLSVKSEFQRHNAYLFCSISMSRILQGGIFILEHNCLSQMII